MTEVVVPSTPPLLTPRAARRLLQLVLAAQANHETDEVEPLRLAS